MVRRFLSLFVIALVLLPSGASAQTVAVAQLSGTVLDDSGGALPGVDVTVTQTEGSGFLRLTGSDLSGERPEAKTSNVNWFANNQTFGNLALTTVGGENGVQVFCGGNGKTHVVVDMMGYIQFIV